MPIFSPTSIQEACEIYSTVQDSSLIAGGTDFMVEVNFNHRKPNSVVTLANIKSLATWEIDTDKNRLRVGSTVPFAEMETPKFARNCIALSQAARTVGSPQIRNTASIGGNLGTCSPAGDSLPVLFALDATIEITSIHGVQEVSIHDFMLGPKRNILSQGEIVSSIFLPLSNGFQSYAKVGVRNAMVISIASACFVIQDNKCAIALGSVGPTIIRCKSAESFLQEYLNTSEKPPNEVFDKFAELVANDARPIDDHRSTSVYRRHAVKVLSRRLATRSFS